MMNKLENLVNQLEKAINIESKPENRILADIDVYYKDSVVFSKDTDIPKDAEYVKVYYGVSEEFLNEVKNTFLMKIRFISVLVLKNTWELENFRKLTHLKKWKRQKMN